MFWNGTDYLIILKENNLFTCRGNCSRKFDETLVDRPLLEDPGLTGCHLDTIPHKNGSLSKEHVSVNNCGYSTCLKLKAIAEKMEKSSSRNLSPSSIWFCQE